MLIYHQKQLNSYCNTCDCISKRKAACLSLDGDLDGGVFARELVFDLEPANSVTERNFCGFSD